MKPALIAVALLVVTAVYAWGVHRHHFLCDDAFISFRYAQHLSEGQGLVWNRGERVEGYTNFLWVLLMAAAIGAGIAPESASVATRARESQRRLRRAP